MNFLAIIGNLEQSKFSKISSNKKKYGDMIHGKMIWEKITIKIL